MKLIVVLAAAGVLVSGPFVGRALAFGVKDVVSMTQDGIPDSLIIAKIQHSGVAFHLNARDFHELKKAGVSNDVVAEMVRTEDERSSDDGYIVYRHPYYVPAYPYDYSPFGVSLRFGWYGGYHRYYGPYPRFGGRPFVGHVRYR